MPLTARQQHSQHQHQHRQTPNTAITPKRATVFLGAVSAVAFSASYQLVAWFRSADTIALGIGAVGSGPISLLIQIALQIGPRPRRWQWVALFEAAAAFVLLGLAAGASLMVQYWGILTGSEPYDDGSGGGGGGTADDARRPLLTGDADARAAADAEEERREARAQQLLLTPARTVFTLAGIAGDYAGAGGWAGGLLAPGELTPRTRAQIASGAALRRAASAESDLAFADWRRWQSGGGSGKAGGGGGGGGAAAAVAAGVRPPRRESAAAGLYGSAGGGSGGSGGADLSRTARRNAAAAAAAAAAAGSAQERGSGGGGGGSGSPRLQGPIGSFGGWLPSGEAGGGRGAAAPAPPFVPVPPSPPRAIAGAGAGAGGDCGARVGAPPREALLASPGPFGASPPSPRSDGVGGAGFTAAAAAAAADGGGGEQQQQQSELEPEPEPAAKQQHRRQGSTGAQSPFTDAAAAAAATVAAPTDASAASSPAAPRGNGAGDGSAAGGDGDAGGVAEVTAEVLRATWQVALAGLASATLLNAVFPFFTYLPSSGMLGERLPQVGPCWRWRWMAGAARVGGGCISTLLCRVLRPPPVCCCLSVRLALFVTQST